MKKAIVYCSKGLGDGILFLIISNNLSKNGYKVDTYHPFLSELNGWFKYTHIKPYPEDEDKIDFHEPDLIIINSDYEPLNKKIVEKTKNHHLDKTYELHPSTCKGKKDFIGDLKFDITKSVNENLVTFCENDLKLSHVFVSNDVTLPSHLNYRKFQKRVAIHPTSKNIKRNWPKEKFQKLAYRLKKRGFEPYFILAPFEREYFEDISDIEIPKFNNLEEMASFIYESAFFIGNDSGIAHLASCLKIPTLTIFANRRKQKFWKASFHIDETIGPLPILNVKGFRLRERFWKKTISIKRVLNSFERLSQKAENYEKGDVQ